MTTSTKTFTLTAKENRAAVLAERDLNKRSMVPVVGNTWPLKSFLFALGSMWDKERKVLTVPTSTYHQAQAAVDAYAKNHPPKSKATVKVEPVKVEVTKPEPIKPVPTAQPKPTTAAPKAASKPITTKPVASSILHDRLNVLQGFIDGTTKRLIEANATEAVTRMANLTACLALVREVLPA